jgi:hypothetical protein
MMKTQMVSTSRAFLKTKLKTKLATPFLCNKFLLFISQLVGHT